MIFPLCGVSNLTTVILFFPQIMAKFTFHQHLLNIEGLIVLYHFLSFLTSFWSLFEKHLETRYSLQWTFNDLWILLFERIFLSKQLTKLWKTGTTLKLYKYIFIFSNRFPLLLKTLDSYEFLRYLFMLATMEILSGKLFQ